MMMTKMMKMRYQASTPLVHLLCMRASVHPAEPSGPASAAFLSGGAIAATWPRPASSVGEVVCLVQLEQEAVGDVERGEADAHSDRALNPVHAQALVQSAHDPLLSHDGAHRPADGAVGRARHAGRLHAPPHHIEGVGGRLTDQAGTGAESQTLVGVGLGAFGFF